MSAAPPSPDDDIPAGAGGAAPAAHMTHMDHTARARERERARIARELHDELGGNLTAIKMALAMLSARLDGADPALRDRADYIDALVDRTIDAVHRISLDLRPAPLDLGLVAALEWQTRQFERQAGVACGFDANTRETGLDDDQAAALFRIAQEALTNIARHANASRVSVRLARLRRHVSLEISDNGRGIGQADRAKPASFGLRGMAERAAALGGVLTLAPAPGGGTVVSIKIKRDNGAGGARRARDGATADATIDGENISAPITRAAHTG